MIRNLQPSPDKFRAQTRPPRVTVTTADTDVEWMAPPTLKDISSYLTDVNSTD